MIEQKIEDNALSKIGSALEDADIHGVQLVSQLRATDGVKGLEDSDASVIIVAKAQPRQYQTPTIPTCQISLGITALVRADVDFNGLTYLGVTDALMEIYQHWQRCYDDTHQDFTVSDEFACTGYQLMNGNFGLDQTGKVWQYEHTMTIYGIVQEQAPEQTTISEQENTQP